MTIGETVSEGLLSVLTLAVLALIAVGLLIAMDRQGKRHHEERKAHRLEVVGLCQRIQDPQAAVYEHATRDAGPEVSAFPMTDEQVAEMQERDLAIARIEAMENGGLGS